MLRAGEFGAGPFTLSMEAIREFEVSSAVYDVSQGRLGGGTIRAATKAGTNDWIGSVFTYYRGSALGAATDYQDRTRTQREFTSVQWGGSIGGPIVRDKAQLFIAFDRQDSNDPLFTGFVQTEADERAAGIARDSLDRLVTILGNLYGTDISQPQIGRLDRRPVSNTLFSRVDWSLSNRHKLWFNYTVSQWDSPLSGGVDFPIALFESRSNYTSTDQRFHTALHSTMPGGLQNDLRVAFSLSRRSLEPNSLAPRGFVRVQSALPGGTTGDTRVQFGGNRLAPDDSREAQFQIMNTTHLQRGNVLFTFGTDNSFTRLSTFIAEAQGGLFEFNSLADLEQLRAARYSRTLPLLESNPTTRQSVLELSAFAQGEWRPSSRLTATFGLRWDGTMFLTKPPSNSLVEEQLKERTNRAPSDLDKIQPRVQIVWDADGSGRNLVRIGAGRFIAQPTYYTQHNQLLNDGRRIADIALTGTNVPIPDFASYREDPSTNPGLPTGANPPAPYVNLVGNNYEMPSVVKATAAYRRKFGERVTLTGSVLYSRTTGNYMYTDRNLRADPAFTLDNESDRAVFVPAATIDAQGRTLFANARANTSLGRVLELTSTGVSEQHAFVLEATVLPISGTRLDASFTWNSAKDNSTYGCCLARTATTFTAIQSDPRDLSGSWGPSDTDFRRKLVVSGSAAVVWGMRIGARYVGSTGRPFSAIVNGDINGDESTSNDLAFVFDPDDPQTPTAIADAMRRLLGNPDNIARDYLNANLGRIASRNGANVPWAGRVDVRATKTIGILSGQSIELGVDIFNFANLLNSDWGSEYLLPAGISNQNPVVQRIPLLNVVGFDQITRRYRYTVNENFGVLQKGGTPYQIQLSLRYGF